MDIKRILNGKHDCACGKEHPCDIRYVEIGDGVLEKLSEICAPYQSILLIADGNTYPLCGDEIKGMLKESHTNNF